MSVASWPTRLVVVTLTVVVVLGTSLGSELAPSPPRGVGSTLRSSAQQTATPVDPDIGGEWIDLTAVAGTAPSPRQAYAMADDPALNEIVLFGGTNANVNSMGDTWVFSEHSWHNITATLAVAPAPREEASLVYDPSMQALILYGGRNLPGQFDYNDTWEFNASGWTQLHPAASPGLGGSSMVYDSTDGYIFLWLEVTTGGPHYYWTFQDGTWTNITSSVTGNLPMDDIIGANDPESGNVVFYGGYTACTEGLGLTYTYSGGVFQNLTSTETTFPTAVEGSTQMTYDPMSDGVVLFSGYSVTCAVTNQTWLFHDGTWTNLTSVSGAPPPGRWDARLAYDPVLGGAITFGGNENPVGGVNSFGDDTWEYVQPIHPNATGSPTSGLAPLVVSLSANPSGGVAPYFFNWSFDDGTPNATTADVAHTFHDPGNYTVTVLVEDSAGFTAHAQLVIEVEMGEENGTLAFTQTGLAGDTEWSVTVGSSVWTSTSGGVANPLTPGSYSYTVGAVAGYSPTPSSGMATVSEGEVTTVPLTFAPASGWIAGTVTPDSATVRVDGSVVTTSDGAFNVSVPAGFHSIQANAAGYAAYYNNVSVSGGKTTHLTILEPALSSSTTTALSSAEFYGIVGAILALAVAVLVAALLLSRRRGRPPPTQAWSSASGAPPAQPPSSGS